MNNHHSLCYNDYTKDEDCELCWVINYVILSITPECSCEYGGARRWDLHNIGCKYAAFMYSRHGGK